MKGENQQYLRCLNPRGLYLSFAFALANLTTSALAEGFILQTGSGQPLQTIPLPLLVPSASLQPVLQFDFAFGTDEADSTGSFLDSFSLTLQSSDGLTALLLTADAAGVNWAPSNPGGVVINPNDITRIPISIPVIAQGFNVASAYTVAFPVPASFAGKPGTLYLDLFDNLTPPNSLGWANNVVIPEPVTPLLALFGAVLVCLWKRRNRP